MHKDDMSHDTTETGILSNSDEVPTQTWEWRLMPMSFILIICPYTSCSTLFVISFTEFDTIKSNNTYTHGVIAKSNNTHTNGVRTKFKWTVCN